MDPQQLAAIVQLAVETALNAQRAEFERQAPHSREEQPPLSRHLLPAAPQPQPAPWPKAVNPPKAFNPPRPKAATRGTETTGSSNSSHSWSQQEEPQQQLAPPQREPYALEGFTQQTNPSPWESVPGNLRCTTGKYYNSGKNFQQIMEEDPGYCKWLLQHSATLKEPSMRNFAKFLMQHWMIKKFEIKERTKTTEPLRPQREGDPPPEGTTSTTRFREPEPQPEVPVFMKDKEFMKETERLWKKAQEAKAAKAAPATRRVPSDEELLTDKAFQRRRGSAAQRRSTSQKRGPPQEDRQPMQHEPEAGPAIETVDSDSEDDWRQMLLEMPQLSKQEDAWRYATVAVLQMRHKWEQKMKKELRKRQDEKLLSQWL